jgi:hypothetical protein
MADPWARPGDLGLRHDIQLLADAGLIKAPVNTWPMPWGALAADLMGRSPPAGASLDVLAGRAAGAADRRNPGLKGLQPNAKLSVRTTSSGCAASRTRRARSRAARRVSWMGEHFAMRAQLSVAPDSDVDDQEWRTDGSYLAGIWRNQIFYASAVDRWWGPSHQDTLILSSNARPVYGLGMQRNLAKPFETRWLSWLGPWTYDFMWGFLESDREIPDARLLAFRFNFRPINDLEIGVTRTACGAARGGPATPMRCGTSSRVTPTSMRPGDARDRGRQPACGCRLPLAVAVHAGPVGRVRPGHGRGRGGRLPVSLFRPGRRGDLGAAGHEMAVRQLAGLCRVHQHAGAFLAERTLLQDWPTSTGSTRPVIVTAAGRWAPPPTATASSSRSA